jgi:hypothetical protein
MDMKFLRNIEGKAKRDRIRRGMATVVWQCKEDG